MKTKLDASMIASSAFCDTIIVSNREIDRLYDVIHDAKGIDCTKICAPKFRGQMRVRNHMNDAIDTHHNSRFDGFKRSILSHIHFGEKE